MHKGYLDLLNICDLLGVKYDMNYLNTIPVCDRITYLLYQIYLYLGGK